MIHHMWLAMMGSSVVYGLLSGSEVKLLEAALEGCAKAVSLTLELCAGYLLFCGLMEIAGALRAEEKLQKLLSPVQKKLMPATRTQEARGAAAMNMAMNVLGMGNAATPAGLDAMRHMEAERANRPEVQHDMEMFLILNATSLQLLPTTVLALRSASGSAYANAVLIPTILCTALSTITGTACGLLCRRWKERRYAD